MVATDAVPVILTHGLGKVYSAGTEAEVVALRGVDMRIDRGEFVAIMGPSGSGKSTLMNLIGCLDTPTSGSYECDGVDVATLDAEALAALRRDKIGFVFQGFHLLPRMNATDNVAMPMGYAQIPPAERRRRAVAALEAACTVPLASRCTASSGCTIQWAVRLPRLTAMVTESTRKGMLACTMCTTVCSLTKPSSASVGLNTRTCAAAASVWAWSSRQWAAALAYSAAGPRVCSSSGSAFS